MERSEIERIINGIKEPESFDGSLLDFRRLSKEEKLKVLDALKTLRDESTGRYLNALHDGEEDKDVQKQIRKLLFGLKTMGIKVEQPKQTGEAVLKKVEETKAHRALLSNYDFQGTRLIVAAYEMKKNAFMFINASTHFSEGLVELMSGPIDRLALEGILKEFLSGRTPNMTAAEISPAYAAHLLKEASARSGKNKDEIKQLLRLAGGPAGVVQSPEDIYGLPVPESTHAQPLDKILGHPIFEPFALTWATAEEDRKAYNSVGGAGSTIVLPPYMVEEKKQAMIRQLEGSDQLASKPALLRRLLEDYAYIFHSLREYPHYKGLIEHLKETSVSSFVMEWFIRKTLTESKESEPGLLVNPYEQIRR